MTVELSRETDGARRWPPRHAAVLAARELGVHARTLSTFGDAVWWLADAHADAHLHVPALNWRPSASLPAKMISQLKMFAFALLHHRMPATLGINEENSWPAVTTVYRVAMDLRPFACWMTERARERFSDVTDADTEAYLDHVRQLDCSPPRRSRLLAAVRMLWAYGPVLPRDCQLTLRDTLWQGQLPNQLVDATTSDRVNKTPRIAAATMDALLAWALRVVEEIGPDIRDAWTAYRAAVTGTHRDRPRTPGGDLAAVQAYLQTVDSLPGRHTDGGTVVIDWPFLSRLLRHQQDQWTKTLPIRAKTIIRSSGLPVDPDAYLPPVVCVLAGRPWRDGPIRRSELDQLIRALSAACFVVTTYLSGMRPGEVLNLRRGCRGTDPDTGELLVNGRPGKGRFRTTLSAIDGRSWTVVAPVHAALAMLEQVSESELLFPASLTASQARRPNHAHARSTDRMNDDIDLLIDWVNNTFVTPDGKAIPTDPAGSIVASRFRRTLAYFIVRRPRGLIAAALQYGHVKTRVTLNYAGDPDPGWLNDLALERLELVLEQIDEDNTAIKAHEHVSGPAAPDYRRRIAASARFAGRVVTSVAGAKRLLAQADPNIHHGEAMTCVWNADTAVCRRDSIEAGLSPGDAPDLSNCRSSCTNLAYTGRDIAELRMQYQHLQAVSSNPACPLPLRQRATAQALQINALIEKHEHGQNMLTGKENAV